MPTAVTRPTMNAVWFENGTAEVREVPIPAPPPEWALIRVRKVGLCGTDRQLLRGYAGFVGIAGHEFVGEVVDASPAWTGKRVVADINVGCGSCARCADSSHHCESRRVLGIRGLDGAFAEYLTLPERNLAEVPGTVADSVAALAEPLAAALHVVDDIPHGADRVVVLGDGPLGQLTAQAIACAGHAVTVVGRHDGKLRRLATLGIATTTALDEIAPSPCVVDCTGRPEGLTDAFATVSPRGTVILKSTHGGNSSVDLAPVVVNECRLVGSRCGDVAAAVRALAEGRIDPDGLVGESCRLDRLPQAIAADTSGALKIQVTIAARRSGATAN